MSGLVIWFTGLPASGKTTVAQEVVDLLGRRKICSCLLDSDVFREKVRPELSYGAKERDDFYTAISNTAVLLAQQGLAVCIAATAPLAKHRDAARAAAPRFLEIYMAAGVDVCARRDPKQLYAQALRGEISHFPGVSAPYETPVDPDYVVEDEGSPQTHAEKIVGIAYPSAPTDQA